MIYYLTYNEPFSGIYNSQVIDVIKHLRGFNKVKIRLIAFLPIGFNTSNYSKVKKQIRAIEPSAIIIPSLPVQYAWKYNWIILSIVMLFVERGSIISREIFASYLAIKCRIFGLVKKVCHDGRGANIAQIEEYGLFSENLKKVVIELEPFVINAADFRLSVSQSLIKYWKNTFNYVSSNHVVIPCTVSTNFFDIRFNEAEINKRRKENDISDEDILLTFSGSTYGWQSLDIIKKFCEIHLDNNRNVKIVFLSKPDKLIENLQQKYGIRIICKWLPLEEVIPFLMIGDYGLLLRESNDTNNTASPTKFAEYLIAGLPVIISDNLEFSNLVKEYDAGIVINNDNISFVELKNISFSIKEEMRKIAQQHFLKNADINVKSYNTILKNIN